MLVKAFTAFRIASRLCFSTVIAAGAGMGYFRKICGAPAVIR